MIDENIIRVNSPQRVLLSGISGNPSITGFAHQLSKQENIKFVVAIQAYGVGEKIDPDFEYIEKIIDHYKAVWADFEESLDLLPPIDEQLLKKMSFYENIFLKMCDRLVPFAEDRITYHARKQMYLKQIRYWDFIIKSNNINLFISHNIPHEMYDYIIYALCKVHNIKTIIFDDVNFLPNSVFLIEDIEKSCINLKHRYEELLETDTLELTKLKEIFANFIEKKHRKIPESMAILFSKEIKENLLLTKLKYLASRLGLFIVSRKKIIQIFDVNYWVNWGRIISAKLSVKDILKYYDSVASIPDLSKKYIYFAIHFQPECSSSPMGGAYVDQLLIAQMISYYLPKDVFIYAKEHPLQRNRCRDANFYNELLKINNLRLIKKDFSTLNLIDNSIAVATMTGTAGWEGFLSGKPVLKFGNSFYQYAPGVFLVKSSDDCRLALDAILDGFQSNSENIKRFLKACEMSSVNAWTLEEHKKLLSNNTLEENSSNLCEAVIRTINCNGLTL